MSRTYGREAPLLTNRRGGAGAYESARAAADDLDAHHPARAHVEALDGPAEDPRAEVLDDAVPPRYDCAHVDGKVDRLLEPIPLRIEDDLRARVRVRVSRQRQGWGRFRSQGGSGSGSTTTFRLKWCSERSTSSSSSESSCSPCSRAGSGGLRDGVEPTAALGLWWLQ